MTAHEYVPRDTIDDFYTYDHDRAGSWLSYAIRTTPDITTYDRVHVLKRHAVHAGEFSRALTTTASYANVVSLQLRESLHGPLYVDAPIRDQVLGPHARPARAAASYVMSVRRFVAVRQLVRDTSCRAIAIDRIATTQTAAPKPTRAALVDVRPEVVGRERRR